MFDNTQETRAETRVSHFETFPTLPFFLENEALNEKALLLFSTYFRLRAAAPRFWGHPVHASNVSHELRAFETPSLFQAIRENVTKGSRGA